MAKPIAYLPGPLPERSGPLARFLPPLPEGVVSSWLKSHAPGGALVLDPFVAQPRIAIEAAQAGYRVIATANNPVTRFLLEMAAAPPVEAELNAIMADLASSRKGEDRLEPHIRGLYLTHCEKCGKEVEAQAYIWERDSRIPVAKVYTCQNCGAKDAHPTDEQDLSRAAQFSGDKLHRARAMERVASPDDPDRQHVEEALETYLPRALYALFTILNKLDGILLTPLQRRHLELLLLNVADYGNSLWTYPPGRTRPRSLAISPKFTEHNIWMALENSSLECRLNQGKEQTNQIPVTIWPELPPQGGGISLYEGRLKDLLEPIKAVNVQAVINAIPRPNQAFWTLSALWAGWLWGKDAVRPFKSVLRRRRYDWNWHCTALSAIFENLFTILSGNQPILGLIAETEPGFLSATLIAAETAGFNLSEYAIRSESMQAQFTWHKRSPSNAANRYSRHEMEKITTQSAIQHLIERREPASFLQISSSSLISLAEETHFNIESPTDPDQPMKPIEIQAEMTSIFEQAFTYRNGFMRLGGSEKSLEVGQWWLRVSDNESRLSKTPLADRIEIEILRYLCENPASRYIEIDRHVCSVFPGLLTPSSEMVQVCIDSYAEQKPDEQDRWHLRPEDDPPIRRENIASIQAALTSLAHRLGFSTKLENALTWFDEKGNIVLAFYIISTAVFGEIIQNNPYPEAQSVLVIPASRANIALLKLKRNAYLNQKIAGGWRFLKFRHVYRMLDNPLLNRENFDHQFTADPLQDATLQMRLL